MTTEDAGRRPKRRCARTHTSSSMPSAVHYVGYVEDDETPEMIMAKFQELERIKQTAEEARLARAVVAAEQPAEPAVATDNADGGAAAVAVEVDGGDVVALAPGGAQELSDEQLLQVFKQTSMFNVKTAMQDNAMLMGIDELFDYTNERYGADEEWSEDEDFLRSFWSDDGEDWDDAYASDEDRRRGRRGPRRAGGSRAPRNASAMRARHSVVTAYNPSTQALVRRKVRIADPDAIVHIRVPPAPLPVSWGRAVRPYVPAERRGERGEAGPSAAPPPPTADNPNPAAPPPPAGAYLEAPSLPRVDFRKLHDPVGGFQAVLINPGWERPGAGAAALSALEALPLPRLVPSGFAFVWTPKQHVHKVCKLMARWKFSYIENLTWVWLAPDASVLTLPSRFVRASHLTLYMFRRADRGRDIELRHQRNPDVTLDCVAAGGAGGCAGVPEETFVAVETLLPTGRGRFLELWAPRGVRRPGWTHVVEAPAE